MLTTRERECLQGRANGMQNKEIARNLGICEGTVKRYLTLVHKRLHTKNTAHAAAKAFARGEIV